MAISILRKKITLSILLLFSIFISPLFCGKIYISKYKSDATAIVYVTEYKSDADLIVYISTYSSDASGKDEIWYYTEYKSDADATIFLTKYKSDADVKVYFSKYKSDARWVNNNDCKGKFGDS